jgi:hypothetical protein
MAGARSFQAADSVTAHVNTVRIRPQVYVHALGRSALAQHWRHCVIPAGTSEGAALHCILLPAPVPPSSSSQLTEAEFPAAYLSRVENWLLLMLLLKQYSILHECMCGSYSHTPQG